jgi:hypothetical protein
MAVRYRMISGQVTVTIASAWRRTAAGVLRKAWLQMAARAGRRLGRTRWQMPPGHWGLVRT